MASFDKAVSAWTDEINAWYKLGAWDDEVKKAFSILKEYRESQDEPGEDSYIETFFHGIGKLPSGGPVWRTMLDTVDREMLANIVEEYRSGAISDGSHIFDIEQLCGGHRPEVLSTGSNVVA